LLAHKDILADLLWQLLLIAVAAVVVEQAVQGVTVQQ
jgi:hypothetical protein